MISRLSAPPGCIDCTDLSAASHSDGSATAPSAGTSAVKEPEISFISVSYLSFIYDTTVPLTDIVPLSPGFAAEDTFTVSVPVYIVPLEFVTCDHSMMLSPDSF